MMNPGISRIAVLPPVITKRSSRLPSLFLSATISTGKAWRKRCADSQRPIGIDDENRSGIVSTDGAATQSGLRAEKGRCHARKRLVNRSYRKWQRKKHGGIWHGVACTRSWNAFGCCAMHTAERDFFESAANCDWVTVGDGYTWNTQDRAADVATARKGWEIAQQMI